LFTQTLWRTTLFVVVSPLAGKTEAQ